MDYNLVSETYRRMSDDELVRVATQDAGGLTDEALAIVKGEIRIRGLSGRLIAGMEVQNKGISEEELNEYCEAIRDIDCPICGGDGSPLNATLASEVISVIFFTTYTECVVIACPKCLDKSNKMALLKSTFLGWWGIPSGLIRTPKAIFSNLKNRRSNHDSAPNDVLREAVLKRVGEIEAFKDDKTKLLQVLMRHDVR